MRKEFIVKILKTIYNIFRDNALQFFEIFLLIISYSIPHFFDIQGLFKEYLTEEGHPTPENAIYYLTIEKGNHFIAICLVLFALCRIRKYNYDKSVSVNKFNCYHNYPLPWYLFCAKILNIKNCNLILVPIYMQFKLISRNVFEHFPLNESEYPPEKDESSKITKERTKISPNIYEVNVILEDTYPIYNNQIPFNKKDLPTLKISRNDGKDYSRHFSEKFINCIINEVRKLPQDITVNIFATTNPMNTIHIVRRVFITGNRGNIKRLYVFQQNRTGKRIFNSKGKKIF